MKSSYKIALFVAAALCLVVVFYYSSQSKPNEAAAQIEQAPSPGLETVAPPTTTAEPATATPTPRAAPKLPTIALDGTKPNPKPTAQPTAPSTSGTYTVKPGDNFARIATEIYGDESYWDDLAKANPTVDPARLKVGQKLKLPDKAALDGAPRTDAAAAAPGETFTYTVKSGDTLSDIARAYYSDTSRWQYLYNVNKTAIGSNPNNLKAGMKLKIPPLPKAAE